MGPNQNYPSKNTLSIAYSGVSINLAKEATTTMAPVIISNDMTARLTVWNTMESSHVATLQLPVLDKQDRQIHIYSKMKASPIISLGVLYHDG